MFKFFKRYAEQIEDAQWYPLISLFIFFLFFVVLLTIVKKMRKERLEELSNIPFEHQQQTDTTP
jgi:cytochrome c oxidase cbb3-type subunit IV